MHEELRSTSKFINFKEEPPNSNEKTHQNINEFSQDSFENTEKNI